MDHRTPAPGEVIDLVVCFAVLVSLGMAEPVLERAGGLARRLWALLEDPRPVLRPIGRVMVSPAMWIALAAVVSSWLTMLPLNAVDWRSALDVSPIIAWNTGLLFAIAALIARTDWRLGLFIGWVTFNATRTPFMARPWTIAAAITMGALAFHLVREYAPRWIRWPLILSGVGQVLVAALQLYAGIDFWNQPAEMRKSGLMVMGTIGHQTMFGAYAAIIGAIAPWWLVPVFTAGVWFSGSRLALLALGVALIVRVWPSRWKIAALATPVLIAFAVNHRVFFEDGKSLDSYLGRWCAWTIGAQVWWKQFLLWGSGTGGWAWFMPQFDKEFQACGANEAFTNPHSLPVGILFEHGLIGVFLAGLLLWGHRCALVRSPAAWALSVLSLAAFPLYLAQVAAPALVAIAITWPKGEQHESGARTRMGSVRWANCRALLAQGARRCLGACHLRGWLHAGRHADRHAMRRHEDVDPHAGM